MIPVQAPETSLRLAKAFNVFGQASIVGLDQVIYPVCIVENLAPSGTKVSRCSAVLTSAAVVGQFSFVILGNAFGLDPIVIRLRRFTVFAASAFGYIARLNPNASPNPVLFGTRLDTGGQSRANYSGGALAGPTGPQVWAGAVAAPGSIMPSESGLDGVVLRPGQNFAIAGDTVNQAVTVTMVWDEEPLP